MNSELHCCAENEHDICLYFLASYINLNSLASYITRYIFREICHLQIIIASVESFVHDLIINLSSPHLFYYANNFNYNYHKYFISTPAHFS